MFNKNGKGYNPSPGHITGYSLSQTGVSTLINILQVATPGDLDDRLDR